MAAAALRSATMKMCRRALDRRAFFTAAAVKEEQRQLLPRFSHGGGLLRRLTSSESPNLANNKHVGKTGPPSTPPSEPLPHDSNELIRNLHPDTLVRVPVSSDPWSLDNPRFSYNLLKLGVGMIVFCAAGIYFENKFLFGDFMPESKQHQEKDD
ncbi:uncharacterized protein LOC119321948 [Triticum dicoccoides]|uniref:uncharacterized protein LOC119321948 n=1 Tax=Triticum dicoccoides TaxID=85692 RepID=UPI000E7C24A6|nr:uncharacterized protein LOC119321948 [Triticum dicoccoides]